MKRLLPAADSDGSGSGWVVVASWKVQMGELVARKFRKLRSNSDSGLSISSCWE